VDGVHLVGQELQTPPEVPLLPHQVVLVRLYLALLLLQGLDEMFRLVEKA